MTLVDWLRSGLRKLRTSRSVPEAPAKMGVDPSMPQARGNSLPLRHVHLGVDFGTCWSKLVLRDYQAPADRCFVVRPGDTFNAGENYRIPSSVTVEGNRLHFGWTGQLRTRQAETHVIRSPKMRAAFPSIFGGLEHNLGLSAEDVSILVVTYLLQVGCSCAQAYCATLSPPATPRMSMSMGVPMSVLDQGPLRNRFLTIARVAFDIWKAEKEQPSFADGIDIDRARALIASARTRTTDRPVSSTRNWIRSEAEAGLLWIYRSPLVPEGLYGCVDVGAGTTDVSFFRLRSRHEENAWVKDALGFYSARSSPPAMDTLGECLAEIGGGAVSPALLRGNEDSIIKRHGVARHECVESVCTQIFDTYCRTWRDAYVKEMRESSWYKYRLFVLGGGSKVDLVAQSLRKSVWPGRLANRDIGNAGFPDDLYDWPDNGQLQPFREDATFLLVAYGLSYLGADVPIVDKPSKIRPLIIQQRVRLPIDQNEKYQNR